MSTRRLPILALPWQPREVSCDFGHDRRDPSWVLFLSFLFLLGLVTPVLRNCAETDIYSLSRSWKVSSIAAMPVHHFVTELALLHCLQELVRKAVEKKLTGADMSNAHFYISNLGMFGVEHFNAILPKNAGTILAVSASKPKVVLQKNGLIGVEKFMNVNATCDHRVIQGAELAGFLRDLADFIENNIDEVMY